MRLTEESQAQNIAEVTQIAVYRLLLKFHRETDCGRPFHWAECERLVELFGWSSWEDWNRDV